MYVCRHGLDLASSPRPQKLAVRASSNTGEERECCGVYAIDPSSFLWEECL